MSAFHLGFVYACARSIRPYPVCTSTSHLSSAWINHRDDINVTRDVVCSKRSSTKTEHQNRWDQAKEFHLSLFDDLSTCVNRNNLRGKLDQRSNLWLCDHISSWLDSWRDYFISPRKINRSFPSKCCTSIRSVNYMCGLLRYSLLLVVHRSSCDAAYVWSIYYVDHCDVLVSPNLFLWTYVRKSVISNKHLFHPDWAISFSF